jgi:hypothetical protein
MGYADCKSLRINELYSISSTYVYLANTYLQLIYLQLVKQKQKMRRDFFCGKYQKELAKGEDPR